MLARGLLLELGVRRSGSTVVVLVNIFIGGSPGFFAAGNPVLSDLNFKVLSLTTPPFPLI